MGGESTEEQFQALHEIVTAARERLEDHIWGYLAGGSETETTLLRNRLALDTCALRPRVLSDVRNINMEREFFGRKVPLPIFLSPVGSLESFWPNGGPEAARAAMEHNIPLFVSVVMKGGLEIMAEASNGPRVYQLYARGDDDWLSDNVQRAVSKGYDAVCITVDNAVTSRRERDIAQRFVKPWRKGPSEMQYQAGFTWEGVSRLKERHPDVPLIIKGIGTGEDAAMACDMGVDVVYVSNHGGRQLDQGRGTFDILPEVVEAVGGRAKVFIDGGFCRGTDILKALAAGADFVGVGRLYLYGLAASGGSGVSRVLSLIRHELEVSMALLGVSNVDDLSPACLHAAPPVRLPHVLSAFPLLDGSGLKNS